MICSCGIVLCLNKLRDDPLDHCSDCNYFTPERRADRVISLVHNLNKEIQDLRHFNKLKIDVGLYNDYHKENAYWHDELDTGSFFAVRMRDDGPTSGQKSANPQD